MLKLLNPIVSFLASTGLACVLVVFLFVLTYLGTLYQVEYGLYAAQVRYFDSVYFWEAIGPLNVPLPGGYSVMALLFANLIVGGIVRLRRTWSRIGILVSHLGIAFLLLAGFVKFHWADEGGMQLYEGQRSSEYVSYHRLEIAISKPLPDGTTREFLIPDSRFVHLGADETATIRHPDLPFVLTISDFATNARPQKAGPFAHTVQKVVDGFVLTRLELDPDDRNAAGCIAAVTDQATGETREGILSVLARQPWAVEAGGERYGVSLRKKRLELSFTIHLDEFTRELYPGTSKPKAFMSDVTVIDGDVLQSTKIQMNEPLRRDDFIVFQSSWGPPDAPEGANLWSGFSVVRNPADQWPLYSTLVIALGLLIHFCRSLFLYLRTELSRA